ncbi:hypothetical protein chiPu_0024124 [Chiloscyllium punctatum]|uniref:Uncharacterized protein n=1 Tax=Chiloscyllium punctatum TaxID=137246 RepID=A0A401TC90_CHIPU|nr:hypothetical protein [Chiloscyllium punctatum]
MRVRSRSASRRVSETGRGRRGTKGILSRGGGEDERNGRGVLCAAREPTAVQRRSRAAPERAPLHGG